MKETLNHESNVVVSLTDKMVQKLPVFEKLVAYLFYIAASASLESNNWIHRVEFRTVSAL